MNRGWWRKQAPAWNRCAKSFAANDDVAFGDVNLSEGQIPGNHNPGAGGWPTIRYFNKETGVAGAAYVKKTSKAICEELGSDEYMTAYVEEYAGTSLCSVVDGKGCSEKEASYIDKMKGKDMDEIEKQLQRLKGMDTTQMKPDLGGWVNRRKKILSKLLEQNAVKEEL